MRNTTLIIAMACVLLATAGCEETKRALGQGKRKPDEFAVYSRAPLSLPPDYSLRPPRPGESRPQRVTPQDKAKSALFGRRRGIEPMRPIPADVSPGAQSILRSAKTDRAEPNIRAIVNQETSIMSEADQTLTERLMFWDTAHEYGSMVDPSKENKRIQENKALGTPITKGETPTIKRKRKALLEGVF